MRFLPKSPSIPDELLTARDEGRVVFFCGAGVSRARAGLPDFFGLAQDVIDSLRVSAEEPARKMIEAVRASHASADRVFGLLEGDFQIPPIEAAVAKALKRSAPDLRAHQVMLDLAQGPDGKVRLVTTNFDLLFEACDGSLPFYCPPRLPNPRRSEDFEGIIHLHGHVDKDYQGSVGGGFILSSSAFGRAYLSDGWATDFIKAVLDKYIVVFVGYAADDPPVQYLLEALNSDARSLEGVYAFQAGSTEEAEAKWRYKGAHPIAYDEAENHRALWETLEAWATRARDPDAWYDHIVAMARKGPDALLLHERGQVAHVVSTVTGARKFAFSDDPPPAEWLCVFDPTIRYATPGHVETYRQHLQYIDPFDDYGLDSDPIPPRIAPNDYYAKRDITNDLWNGFALTKNDRQALQEDHLAALCGHWSVKVPQLPRRLAVLGYWISKVSHQPTTVWWAAAQPGIHPTIQDRIRYELTHGKKDGSPEIRQAWRYIFEVWERRQRDFHDDGYQLKKAIDLDGWTNATVRDMALICRPYIKMQRPYSSGPKPPKNEENIDLSKIIYFKIQYPPPLSNIQIPDNFLAAAVRELRKHLEYASALAIEIDTYGLDDLCPIVPDTTLAGRSADRQQGVSCFVMFYSGLYARLIEKDPTAAKQEYLAWPIEDDKIFTRLRIWVSGDRRLLAGNEAGKLICDLSDTAFWDQRHQRDLLLVLAQRWHDYPATVKRRIEKRLLRGPSRWPQEKKADYNKIRAHSILERIYWLEAQGCCFTFDITLESTPLRKFVPEWRQAFAARAVASMESRLVFVSKDTNFSALLAEPLDTLLGKAAELSGRTDNRLVEKNPFAGLVAEKPVRAFAALIRSAKRQDYPDWAWREFLYSEARRSDKPRFSALIAMRLQRLPTSLLAKLIAPVSDWLVRSGTAVMSRYPDRLEPLWLQLMTLLTSAPELAKSSVVRGNKEPDWLTEALNAPVGKLAQWLMADPVKNDLPIGKGFPSQWISHGKALLDLEGDPRRHALAIFAFHLNWFYAIGPDWTEANLLSVLYQDNEDQDAFWAGFFRGSNGLREKLGLRLKPYFLKRARQDSASKNHIEVLAAILLSGWGSFQQETGKQYISDTELSDILINTHERFRLQIVGYLRDWLSNHEEKWKENLFAFFDKIWPRHKKVNSPRVSASMCSLAFSKEELFPQIVDMILPLVTTLDSEHTVLPELMHPENKIVERYPEKLLALLSKVLPENMSVWPYNFEELVERIEAAAPSLRKDPRLVELKRRWNAR